MADGRWQLDLDLFPNQFSLTAIRQKVLQMGGAFALAITRRNLRHNYATNFLCPDSTFFLGIAQKGVYSATSKIMIQKNPEGEPSGHCCHNK